MNRKNEFRAKPINLSFNHEKVRMQNLLEMQAPSIYMS